MKEMVGGCCVCSDDRGWAENPLVYCDGQGCTVAVHQACYGIVTVPTGNWYCRKCESQERSVRIGPRQHCELCPSRDGALKRTDNSGWAHVVCALYIPEVRFGNVTTMEPILLQQIPAERFSKVCYICEESGKGTRSTIGACMQCNKSGCKQQFHVTCAQTLGLLCEEAGNYLDNVKYCGYCQHHYSKLKKGGNVKTIPPYRPVTVENSDASSPEKEPSENWTKTSGKRKPSTNSSKNNAATPSSGTKSVTTTAIKSETNPGPSVIAETAAPTPADENPTVTPPPPVSTVQVKDLMLTNTKSDPASSGKFTTSNFVESVVTPSDSVFGDTGKPGKKRKSQSVQPVKEETAVQPSSVISTNTSVAPTVDDNNKRLRVEPLVPVARTESPTPSVVVRIQTTTPPSTSPSLTPPITRAAVATSSPLTVTSSIVVSVPLTAAAIPPNAVTTTPASPATPVEEQPAKRGRSQSSEKPDKGRKQKRGTSSTIGSTVKRGSRSNQVSPPSVQVPATVSPQMTTMAPIVPTTATTTTTVVTHSSTTPSPLVKESLSPPSSPEMSRRSGQRTRKQPTPNQPPPSRDDRDARLFQNGVNAPHMLGNQLNPASTMAQKMSDTLNQELEAHSIFTSEANLSTGQLIGPQLHSRVIATARSAGSGSSANSTPQSSATPPAVPTASTSTTLGVNWGGPNSNITPQTLDQLLERQWEQGSQFLMEQAQHFDIASLLSCLHQLRAENLRLEEHVSSLLQRRDHLLAVNARLAIPLIPTTPIVNNIHPATAAAVDSTRSSSSQSGRINNSYMQPGTMPLENGPPPSPPSQQQYHRTPVTQPSPNTATRHHSPGSSQGYVMHPTSTASGPGVVVRGGSSVPTDPLRTDRRSSSQSSSSHQQGYPAMYQVPTQQPQIVMRREVADLHHQNSSSKPS